MAAINLLTEHGRMIDRQITGRAMERRERDRVVAAALLRGGLSEHEVYAGEGVDVVLDVETRGAVVDWLGRELRRHCMFASEAHRRKTREARTYHYFLVEEIPSNQFVVQIVLRPLSGPVPVRQVRESHATISRKLNDHLRYASQIVDIDWDLLGVHLPPADSEGNLIDMHFHLSARVVDPDDLWRLRQYLGGRYFYWDEITSADEDTDENDDTDAGPAERRPAALASYLGKGLAGDRPECSTTDTNLAELFRQTVGLALLRPLGAYRGWKGELAKTGHTVRERSDGEVFLAPTRARPRIKRFATSLFKRCSYRLLGVCVHNFGGQLRVGVRIRVTGPCPSWQKVGEDHDVRWLEDSIKENTAIPEYLSNSPFTAEELSYQGLVRPSSEQEDIQGKAEKPLLEKRQSTPPMTIRYPLVHGQPSARLSAEEGDSSTRSW